MSIRTWWGRRRGGRGRDRGFVEAGVAAAGGLLVLGAVVGNGVAATLLDMSDGQTWLPDSDGRIVQVNPATGQPERRLVVGADGSELAVSQRDGHLIVSDLTSGEITAIDLAALVASGARGVDADTRVLVGGGQVVLVDLSPGTVRAVDPLTLADLGAPYRTDDLADAVIDDEGSVWILTTSGELAELDYAADAGSFVVGVDRPVDGAGRESRLVPHRSGATVFAPDGGAVVQVGAGRDVAVSVAALEGTIAAAQRSPADLVPASATDVGRVFLLTGGQILNVDIGGLGCERPGVPTVFEQRIYVPCLGAGQIIVLGADGSRAGADIIVPGGGDPELVVDEGRLFVHTPDDDRIVVVQPDGTSQVVDVGGSQVPEQDVDRPEPDRPGSTPVPVNQPQQGSQLPPPPQNPPPGQDNPPPDGAPEVPATSEPPREGGRDDSPTDDSGGVDANDSADSSTDDARDDSADDATDGSTDGATDGSTDGSTDDGTDDSTDDATDDSTDDSTDGESDLYEVTGVSAQSQADDRVRVTWDAPEPEVAEFIVTSSDGSFVRTVDGDSTAVMVDELACGTGTVQMTVTAHFAEGPEASDSDSVARPECDPTEDPTTDDPTTDDPTEDPTTDDPTEDPTTEEPVQATAATNVSANRSGSSVTVSWTGSSSGADEYLVYPSGQAPTSAGTSTSLTLTLSPGEYSFRVETQLEDTSAMSSNSNTVTVAGVPGAPGTPSVSGATNNGSTVTANLSWSAATANGSSVTGYTVSYSGGGVSGSTTTSGTSTSLSINCSGQSLCTSGGTLNVTVTATNGEGTGNASGTGSGSVPAPPPPPPANGDTVISVGYGTPGLYDETIPMQVYYSPTPGWAAHTGTCTLYIDGSPRVIDCNSGGVVGGVGVTQFTTVTAYITATGAGVNATSATAAETAPARNTWAHCPPDGPCTDPVSAPIDPDGHPDVQIEPLPWAPPEVPKPPVLVAGIGLLGAAGLLRTLRRRESELTGSVLTGSVPTSTPDQPLLRREEHP